MLSSIQSFLRRFTARSLLPKVVPIRTLKAKHRPLVLHHLLQLNDADRFLRFGYLANDAQLPATSKNSTSPATKCLAFSTAACN